MGSIGRTESSETHTHRFHIQVFLSQYFMSSSTSSCSPCRPSPAALVSSRKQEEGQGGRQELREQKQQRRQPQLSLITFTQQALLPHLNSINIWPWRATSLTAVVKQILWKIMKLDPWCCDSGRAEDIRSMLIKLP